MRKSWNNKWTFLLAASGSAIGLGNVWKFPYIAAQNGGGAFVITYLACLLLMGLPLLIAETAIGRYTGLSPLNGIKHIIKTQNLSKYWTGIAWMGMLSSFLILSFYSVIAGWCLAYAWDLLLGSFNNLNAHEMVHAFSSLTNSASRQIFWHSIFMLITLLVVARGIHKGLEKSLQIMMPILFILLIVMLVYSIVETGHFKQGLDFMFALNFKQITLKVIVAALGQAFFTLSLGMCAIMAYGAYMPKNNHIGKVAINVLILDTAMALIAGLIIFPIVFAYNLEPTSGPKLLFVSLATAFGNMPFGDWFGFLFFVLVGIAALSSAISLLEPILAWGCEYFKNTSRAVIATILSIIIWFVGLGTVYSFTGQFTTKFFGKNFFNFIDFLTNNLLLPLGGVLIAIFAGWILKRSILFNELQLSSNTFNCWRATVRVLVPVCILIVLISTAFG